eukprot:Nitzschia sp. Nitz4//scaffold20_size174350//67737//69092//NITZ4_002096-RA/size174350-processed-gene-0.21-mRNA-1//1//CDS//3329541791//2947//frame0
MAMETTAVASMEARGRNPATSGGGGTKTTTPTASLVEKGTIDQLPRTEPEAKLPASTSSASPPTMEAGNSSQGPMKLVVRSPYWGRILKGKTRRNYDHGSAQTYRVITCQAVLQATEGQYWGCCPHHGKRVLELKEVHFQDAFSGDWDLYMIGSTVAPTYVVHAYFLLPKTQTTIDVDYKVSSQGWTYVGTANSSVVRMDLEAMLESTLNQNEGIGFRFHHVHLEILMDQVYDRETPRSRKVAIEKNRSNNAPPHSHAATGKAPAPMEPFRSGSSAHTHGSGLSAPPIPNVVSNDASFFSESSAPSWVTQENMSQVLAWYDGPSMQPYQYAYPPPNHHWEQPNVGIQWYPASLPPHAMRHPLAQPPPPPPHYTSHHGNPGVPCHFLPTHRVGAMRPVPFPHVSPHPHFVEHRDDHNVDCGGTDLLDGHSCDVETASVSETTGDDDTAEHQP